MGVPGLWDLIRPAAVRTSLHALSRDAFLANKNGLRALTIGIDASIWIFHAQTNRNGANAFLRTIFYKIAALLQHPVLPVFVFDGPKKPRMKRGRRVTPSFGVLDGHSRQFKGLLDMCGLEWWNVRASWVRFGFTLTAGSGEAEAELALMNRQGKIDAVLSDDVDALVFGATCLLRNNSPTLSGTQASSTQNNSSRSDQRHYEMYHISDIVAEWSRNESALETEDDCQLAMVLVALLAGGDYVPEGVEGMGPKIAFGLAKAGHADFLKLYTNDRSRFDRTVAREHAYIIEELATNSSGHIGRRMRGLAGDLAHANLFEIFPLDCYLNPATSPADDPEQGWPGFGKGEESSSRGRAQNLGRGALEGMARACERYFEWGTREIVCKKFASDSVNLFGAEIVSEARRLSRTSATALARPTCRPGESPERITSYLSQSTISSVQGRKSISTRSARHLVKIHSTRQSPVCPSLTEYRLEYQPQCYMDRCREAMDGHRADPSTLTPEDRVGLGLVEMAAPADTSVKEEVRIWIADYLVRAAWPHLITKYEDDEAAKAAKKAMPKKKTAANATSKGRKKAAAKTASTQTLEDSLPRLPASQSAVREVRKPATSQSAFSRRCIAANTSASQPTPAPSSPLQRQNTRVSSQLSSAASSPLSLPSSSPLSSLLPDLVSLPSPPLSPSKRDRSTRSPAASSRGLSSRNTSPSPSPPDSNPLSTRRAPQKKPVSSPRVAHRTTTVGSAADPICLLSSDDDEPTPRPLRSSREANVLPTPTPETSPATRGSGAGRGRAAAADAGVPSTNVSTPTRGTPATASRRATATVPARTPATSAHAPPCGSSAKPTPVKTNIPTQTRLDSMIVARARKNQPIKKPPSVPKPQPARVPYFVVSQDDDGVEHIDLTKPRPRRAR